MEPANCRYLIINKAGYLQQSINNQFVSCCVCPDWCYFITPANRPGFANLLARSFLLSPSAVSQRCFVLFTLFAPYSPRLGSYRFFPAHTYFTRVSLLPCTKFFYIANDAIHYDGGALKNSNCFENTLPQHRNEPRYRGHNDDSRNALGKISRKWP